MTASYGDPKFSSAANVYARGAGVMSGSGGSYTMYRSTRASHRQASEEPAGEPEPYTSSGRPFGVEQASPAATNIRSSSGDSASRSSGEEFVRVRNLLAETRRFSALTMDEIAAVLGVSRRTLYNWRDGEPPGEQNLHRLVEFRRLLDEIDRGFGVVNAKLLRETRDEDGMTCMELLQNGAWDSVSKLIGAEPSRRRVSTRKLSDLSEEQREQAAPPSTGKRPFPQDEASEQVGTEWLVHLYGLLEAERIDEALDLTVDTVDDCLKAGDFELVDRSLRELDVARLDTNLIVGWLAITKSARKKLLERSGFVERAENRLKSIAPNRIGELIDGLR